MLFSLFVTVVKRFIYLDARWKFNFASFTPSQLLVFRLS